MDGGSAAVSQCRYIGPLAADQRAGGRKERERGKTERGRDGGEEEGREGGRESERKREGRGKAVRMITSQPHCCMERCPANSFHHGPVRRSRREREKERRFRRRRRGWRGWGGRAGAVEDTSCVAG